MELKWEQQREGMGERAKVKNGKKSKTERREKENGRKSSYEQIKTKVKNKLRLHLVWGRSDVLLVWEMA